MNKAILVIDMPSCCEMCDLRCLNYQHGYDFCSASEEVDIDYTNYKAKRNEKCPLKPIPTKEEIYERIYQAYGLGKNEIYKRLRQEVEDIYDEILGEKE